ncbi:MAG: hypothetical protein ACO3R5_07270 [Pseudohongiellaceae bacterium]
MPYVTHTRTALLLTLLISSPALAQDSNQGIAAQEVQTMPEVVPPPQEFASAEAHYRFLLDAANGGTRHTLSSLPQWPGLWTSGNNTMPGLFIEDGTLMSAITPGGTVKTGVLTPPYEAQFRQRRAEMAQYGEQLYDRLTNCEYPGMPRWLWEPYLKEFVHMPDQSWMMNDMMNETRRIYINAEHVNIDAKHLAAGDSIGFWDDDKLIIWTKWINPADYLRGMPLTSNRFELVETWQQVTHADGSRQLVTQVTFYDPVALVKSLSAVYTHDVQPALKDIGVRIRNWECTTSSNSYKAEDGSTQFYLPGDPQYKDPRGSSEFPDLPGQSFDPIFDNN